jgi:hypothetical protein
MKKILLSALSGCILLGCSTTLKTANSGKNVQVVEEKIPAPAGAMISTEGINSYTATTVNYKRQNKSILNIQLNEPVTISVASKPEKWGYFQFPNIGIKQDGSLQAKWNMTRDAIEAYGDTNSGSANSKDGGKTWHMQEKAETTGGILLPNGDKLEIVNPKPIKVNDLTLPKTVGNGLENYRKSNFTFYRLHDLPESRQGVFFSRLKKGETEWKEEHASLNDPKAARYSLAGLVPVVWWGDMHIASDGSVIAGVYPGFLIGEDGLADPRSGVFFYRSTDNGHSWTIQGRIPYAGDMAADSKADKRMGFTEPGFEILSDGTFLCVMRTTDGAGNGPMYASYSKDMGKTWTNPKAITATGVLPRLVQLDNGVTVLASGRPGVQLRFSVNGKDGKWTDPFEMLPYSIEQNVLDVTCGYTGLLATGKDRFLLIYSDFKYKTEDKNIRKAIKVREVIVKVK